MSTRSQFPLVVVLMTVLICSCGDSENCPSSSDRIDPPISDLSVTWKEGWIGANLMPIVLPDPIGCDVWLILENRNQREAFSKIEIPSANVVLAKSDSTLGTIQIDTDWDGLLAPGGQDTILFFKITEAEEIFSPPCQRQVLMDFTIRNSDGDTEVFRPDTLTFSCVF